ncbi:MAG: hypothetical protein RR842_12420 [Gordonibacter sp.]|uniref:BglG family transcription antiterminator n=2 Tax=Gordonibacter sp. TaxID=1968902 RepID=UPI002FC657BD
MTRRQMRGVFESAVGQGTEDKAEEANWVSRLMLSERQMSVVRDLLRRDDYVAVGVLAERFACSERTIHYDTHSINRCLTSLGLRSCIAGRRGLGVRLDLADGERLSVEELVEGGTFSGYSDLERFVEGMLLLACDEGRPQTVKSLSKSLFVNERQLRHDLHGWGQLLEPFGCSLEVEGHVRLKGDEFAVRVMLLFLFCSFAPVSMLHEVDGRFTANTFLMKRIVEALERCQGFPFSESARRTLHFAVGLALSRMRGGHIVSFDPHDCKSLPLGDQLKRDIARGAGVWPTEGEMEFFRRTIVCGTRRFDTPLEGGRVESNDTVEELASRLLEAMAPLIAGDEFQNVRDILESLIDHALMRRALHAPIPFRDPFAIKVCNMPWYVTVLNALWQVDDLMALKMFGGDIDRIALLMLSVFERVRPYEKCRIAMVVNCGVEQVYYARHRLERMVPDSEVVRVLSDSSFAKDGSTFEDGIDMVVAFEHVETTMPVCQISFAVDESDAKKVSRALAQWRKGMRHENSGGLVCPCETLGIHVGSPVNLAQAIYRSAVGEGLLEACEETFEYVFNISCVICETMAVAVIPLAGVVRTAGRRYVTQPLFVGRKLGKFAVLYVAQDDMPFLPSVVAQFKEYMDIPETCAVSWELPPLLGSCAKT